MAVCYSVLIKAQLKALALEFGAAVDVDSFASLFALRLPHPELKVPFALDRYFVLSQDPAERRLAPIIRQFHAEEKMRAEQSIRETEEELRELAAARPTVAHQKKREARERRVAKLKLKLNLDFDRISPLDERTFPGVFAPVILGRESRRWVTPMRYRVRCPDGGEVPSQYNVFNARRDSLLQAATWRPLFGHAHALFPFSKFFEWVERDGKKREIAFTPENRALMWAASLYSAPQNKNSPPYLSFAMVTDDPPAEVAAAGHDRCPIFLRAEAVETWLYPEKSKPAALLALLGEKEKAYYLNSLVA